LTKTTKGTRYFLASTGYFLFAYPAVTFICFFILKWLGTDTIFTYRGYVFPCHAHYKTVIVYSKFADFFTLWGRVVIAFGLMIIGYIMLAIRQKANKVFLYIALIFTNTLCIYSAIFIYQITRVYFLHQTLPFTRIENKPAIVKGVWLLMIFLSALSFAYTAKKYFSKSDRQLLAVIFPAAAVFFYFAWFWFIGPMLPRIR
jgi:hypothetical protein